jgi:hypothetical protein
MTEVRQVRYLKAAEIIGARNAKAPIFYSASGYGRKIPTNHMIQLADKRWRRVYLCQISNAGTAYVLERGEWLVVGSEAETAIESLEQR